MSSISISLMRIATALLLTASLTAACAPAARRPGGITTPGGPTAPGGSATPGATPGGLGGTTGIGGATGAGGTSGPSNAGPGGTGTAATPGVGSADARRIADDIRVAAQSVAGVSRAHVVFVGNVAMVGIETATAVQPGTSGGLEARVGDAVRAREPRIAQVYVTTKPDLVGSLQRIAQGTAAGQPVGAFTSEIVSLLAQLSPAASPRAGVPAAAAPGAPGPGRTS